MAQKENPTGKSTDKTKEKPEEKKIFGMKKQTAYIVGGIVVVILAVVIYKQTKK
jgi:hypothetical protein